MDDERTGIPTPRLDNQSEATADELPGLASHAEPEATATATPKKRRKRGPNKAKAAQTAPIQDPEKDERNLRELGQAFGMAFAYGAKVAGTFRGPHWELQEDESAELGQAWAVAMAPYMGALAPYMPFVTACIVTVGVFAPRISQDRAIREGRHIPLPAKTPDRRPPNDPADHGMVTLARQSGDTQAPVSNDPADRPDIAGNNHGFPPGPDLGPTVGGRRRRAESRGDSTA
jgi:hypothetical protein